MVDVQVSVLVVALLFGVVSLTCLVMMLGTEVSLRTLPILALLTSPLGFYLSNYVVLFAGDVGFFLIIFGNVYEGKDHSAMIKATHAIGGARLDGHCFHSAMSEWVVLA